MEREHRTKRTKEIKGKICAARREREALDGVPCLPKNKTTLTKGWNPWSTYQLMPTACVSHIVGMTVKQ